MRVAVYARVSTTRQAQAQTIEQQLDRLVAAVSERGWTLDGRHVYRDDGYSGASLGRPGLDCLRDHAALAEVDLVVVTAPDRLARNYVHQVLLLDELGRNGCQVEFLDRPMSQDPHDQLLLQIRGAVAEYERTLIAERMRRGRQAKLRAGTLLPWTTPPFGYRLDPERPRDVAGVRVERAEAVLVAQLFDWYLEPQATVYRLAKRLTDLQVATPTGKPRWNAASVRGILRNPAYAGRALTNRTRVVPARRRKSALLPVGPGDSHAPRPQEDWIAVPVPQIVSEETFARVQAKLDTNQQSAARNTRHDYLLRALVSCGRCRLSCTVRRTQAGYRYYLCRGRTDALRVALGAALRRPLHPDRAAGRAGLGRPVRAASRSRAGRLCAGAGAGWGVAAPRAPSPPGDPPPGPGPAGAPAAAAAGRLPGRGARARRVRPQAAGAGPPPGHAGRPAAPAGCRRRAAAGAARRRRWDRGVLPDRPVGAGNRNVRPAAAAGRAAHRPGGRDRRRGGDPLCAANLTRRPASALLPVAERPSRSASAAWPAGPAPPAEPPRAGSPAST
jgi:DNA invertase Pin-like site-specific DNA recombinase